jgi:hypothetical protein
MPQLVNKMSLKHSLVAKFQRKSKYAHQLISCPKGEPKELRRARRFRYPENGSVVNASKLYLIMMPEIAQIILLADIQYF